MTSEVGLKSLSMLCELVRLCISLPSPGPMMFILIGIVLSLSSSSGHTLDFSILMLILSCSFGRLDFRSVLLRSLINLMAFVNEGGELTSSLGGVLIS